MTLTINILKLYVFIYVFSKESNYEEEVNQINSVCKLKISYIIPFFHNFLNYSI